MTTKVFTIQDFLDAIEANHIPHKRGAWFARVNGDANSRIGAACVLGQAAINLGVSSTSLQTALNKVVRGAAGDLIYENDSLKYPYPLLVKRAKEKFKGYEDVKIELVTQFYHSEISHESLLK